PGEQSSEIEHHDAITKTHQQLILQPTPQSLFALGLLKLLNTLPDLSDRNDAQIHALRGQTVHPFHHARVRLLRCQLGNDAGIEEVVHSFRSGLAALRSRSRSTSASGDLRKNSDSGPWFFLSLRNSGKDRTTATSTPR